MNFPVVIQNRGKTQKFSKIKFFMGFLKGILHPFMCVIIWSPLPYLILYKRSYLILYKDFI